MAKNTRTKKTVMSLIENKNEISDKNIKWELDIVDADFSVIPEVVYKRIQTLAKDVTFSMNEKEKILTVSAPEAICAIELFNASKRLNEDPSKLRSKMSKLFIHFNFSPNEIKTDGTLVYRLPIFSYCMRETSNKRRNDPAAFMEDFHCTINKTAHPCRLIVAAYYRYMSEVFPQELKKQRDDYRKNKDAVDASLVYFPLAVLENQEEWPNIPCSRLDQLREIIDDGQYRLGMKEFDVYKGGKILNVIFGGKEIADASHLVTEWIKNPNGHSIFIEHPEVMQLYFVMYLLYEDKYQEYYEAQQKFEEHKESLEVGSSYFGCVTGNDTKAVLEKGREICQQIIKEKMPAETKPVEFTMFNLAESTGRIAGEGIIQYLPITDNKAFLIDGIREFLTINAGNTPDSMFGRQITHLIKELKQFKDNQFIIITGTEAEIKDFFALDPALELKFGQHTYHIPDMSLDELYENFKLKMPKTIELTDENETQFKEYLSYNLGAFPLKNTGLVNYLVNFCIENGKFMLPKDLSNAKRKNFMQDLDEVVGMENIKKSIVDFYNYARFQKAAKDLGADIPRGNMHMVFTGNAGTGKTMTANIIAKALYDIGVVKENKVVMAERKDLVAEYVGQTAVKTSKVIEEALGGVLFIDEAYSLNAGSNHNKRNDFGSEAIATLLTAMEGHQDDLIVIFAGYKKEMREFIDMNPGIASRIGYTFNFKDYDENELVEIFKKKIKKAGLTLDAGAEKPAKTLMQYFGRIPNIGNGRFAEKMCNLTIRKHANINNTDDFLVIKEEDIPTVKEVLEVLPDGEEMLNPEEITDTSKKKTTYHELGHALVGIKYGETVKKITIEPSGMGWLGFVEYAPKIGNDDYEGLVGDISRCLAGMAAEKVFNGKHESGVSDDLKKAKEIANAMVTEYGMGTTLSVEEKEVNNEINKILDLGLKNAIRIIEENKDIMEKAAIILLDKGTMTGEEITKVLKETA